MMDLVKSREEIDQIDAEIVKLFEQRMELSKGVAEYKLSVGKKIFDAQREEEKLECLESMAGSGFNRHGIRELFTQIMSMSRKLQYSLLGEQEKETNFIVKKCLDVEESTKVVCFGMNGSHSEQAMEDYFGKKIISFHENTFREVMQAVKEGRAEYGILPIENSSTGSIMDIYDLLVEYDNYIIGEHINKIDQVLLGLKGARIDQLTEVYSHPQGLQQCSKFLDQYKGIKRMEYPSTAEGAQKVAEDGVAEHAAIASRRAAEYYGLEVLKDSIHYNSANSTRFIIITNQRIYLEGADKISVCFELPHTIGTLYNMLSHFIYNNLNMTQIVSRPVVGKSFEYRFFIEFEGNLEDAGVKNALLGIKEEAASFKILGNFLS